MILPCFIVPLNYMWHLFTLPTFYNYRYSYLLCLFMIIIAYKSITNLKISRTKIINYIIIVLINSFLFIIITKFSSYYPNLNYDLILLTLLFIILYNILLLKLKNKTIIVIVMIIEIIINTNLTFKNTEFDKIEVINNYQTFQNQLKNYNSDNRIDIIIKPKKDGFKTHSINNSIFLNYRTTSTFLSTNNINSYKVLINIGLNEDYNKHNYFENKYNSKIYNALFGNKYIISEQKDYDYELIDEINFKETYYVYKNPDYLSIGYTIKDKCNDIEFSFPYDEKILNCLVKSNNKYYIENKPIKQENNILEYDINNKGYYIIYKNKINKYIKEKDILTPIDIVYRNADYILLQNNKKNNKLKINSNISSEDIKVYNIDYKSIKKDIDELKLEQLNYKIEGNKLIGTIDTNGGILLLTLPYEKGYIIRVNGTPTHYEKVLSSFLGIKLDKGIYEIVVEYKQPYLKQGIIMTLIAILITILYLNKLKKNN